MASNVKDFYKTWLANRKEQNPSGNLAENPAENPTEGVTENSIEHSSENPTSLMGNLTGNPTGNLEASRYSDPAQIVFENDELRFYVEKG
jgi:hypothetical protein